MMNSGPTPPPVPPQPPTPPNGSGGLGDDAAEPNDRTHSTDGAGAQAQDSAASGDTGRAAEDAAPSAGSGAAGGDGAGADDAAPEAVAGSHDDAASESGSAAPGSAAPEAGAGSSSAVTDSAATGSGAPGEAAAPVTDEPTESFASHDQPTEAFSVGDAGAQASASPWDGTGQSGQSDPQTAAGASGADAAGAYGSGAAGQADGAYGAGTGYGADSGYGSGYDSGSGYGSGPASGSDSAYGAGAGYGSAPNRGSDSSYGSASAYGAGSEAGAGYGAAYGAGAAGAGAAAGAAGAGAAAAGAYGSGPGQDTYPRTESYGTQNAPGEQSGPGAQSAPGEQGTYAAAPLGSAGSGQSGPYGGSVPQPAPAPGFAGGGSTAAAGGAADAAGGKKKSKMPLFISLGAVALVLILVLVGFFVVRSVNQNKYGPDALAQEYLSALETGKMDAANDIVKAQAPSGANEKLLVQPIVDGSKDKITDTKIVETTRNGDAAKIHAQYTLGGQPYDLVLTAQKDGRQSLFFDKWRLEPPVLPTVALEVPPIEGSTVNGTEFTGEEGRVEYAVWPGRYDVATPEGKYFTSSEGSATVGFADEEQPQASAIKLSVEATDAFDDDVTKAVEDKINECMKEKKVSVDGCPMVNIQWQDDKGKATPERVNEKTIDRKVEKMPAIKPMLSPDGSSGSFYTASDKQGKMKVYAESKDKRYKWDGSVDFSANGTVTIDGDSLSISFY